MAERAPSEPGAPAVPPRRREPQKESPVSLMFTDTGENTTLLNFYDENKHRFPMLAAIVLGIYGLIDMDTFCGGQIMYIHDITSQRRVVARDARNRTFSMPLDYHIKFKVVKSRNVDGEEQTLREIVENNTLPIQVKFSVSSDTAFYIGPDQQKAKDFNNMVLVKEFEERYLLVNCVVFDKIDPLTVPLPMYLTEMTLARVTGIEGYSEQQWKHYLEEVKEDMKKVKYDPEQLGNKDIAYYAEDFEIDADNNYEFLVPDNYLSLKSEFRDNSENLYSEIELPPPPLPKRSISASSNEQLKKSSSNDDRPEPETVPYHDYKNLIPRQEVTPMPQKVKAAVPPKSKSKREDVLLTDLTISTLAKKLKELKLDRHIQSFKKARVDGSIAAELTKDILVTEFGFSDLETIKFMKYVTTGHIPK